MQERVTVEAFGGCVPVKHCRPRTSYVVRREIMAVSVVDDEGTGLGQVQPKLPLLPFLKTGEASLGVSPSFRFCSSQSELLGRLYSEPLAQHQHDHAFE